MSTIMSVWAAELCTQIRPRLPTRTVTALGTVWPGPKLTFEAFGGRDRAAREHREEATHRRCRWP